MENMWYNYSNDTNCNCVCIGFFLCMGIAKIVVNVTNGATATATPGVYTYRNIITVNFNNVPAATLNLYLGVKAKNGINVSTTVNTALPPATYVALVEPTLSTSKLLKVTASVPTALLYLVKLVVYVLVVLILIL